MTAPTGYRLFCVGAHAADAARYPSSTQVLAQGLAARGHETVLATPGVRPLARLAEIRDRIPRSGRTWDAVLVDTYSTRALWYARYASRRARRAGTPSIALLRGGALPELARRRHRGLRAHLARADAVVAPSPFLAREVGGPLDLRVRTIPHALPLDAFAFRARTAPRPRLLWVRAFHAMYRPEDALGVLDALRETHPEATLVMAGPDKDGSLDACRSEARARGLADAVSFPGLVDKATIRQLGSEADVFLNTTGVDNTPVSVIEAMAMGLCVVSTDAGGLPDLVEDGVSGRLFEVGRVEAGADCVREILAAPERAAAFSHAARERAGAFDAARVLDQWTSLLDEICGNGA